MQATKNYVLPQGSAFQAVVNGRSTGLAGCSQSAECPKAATCLRADELLKTRFAMATGPLINCESRIPN